MNIKACIFDLDGVLVQLADLHYQSWLQLASSLGKSFTREQNQQLKGLSRVDSLHRILKWVGIELPEEEFAELLATKNQYYLDRIETLSTRDAADGVADFLKFLQDTGVSISLGSSSKNANRILEKIGLKSYFDVVFDGNHVHASKGKPEPDIFLCTTEHLNILPAEVIVFDDSHKGIEAALKGGFHAVGVGSSEQLSNADVVISSFTDLDWHALLAKLVDIKK